MWHPALSNGTRLSGNKVVTRRRRTDDKIQLLASIPDVWSACSLAATARSSSDSVVQTWRLLIPVRVKIHSSEVSRNSDSSSLETLRAGSAEPVPSIVKPITNLLCVVDVFTSTKRG